MDFLSVPAKIIPKGPLAQLKHKIKARRSPARLVKNRDSFTFCLTLRLSLLFLSSHLLNVNT